MVALDLQGQSTGNCRVRGPRNRQQKPFSGRCRSTDGGVSSGGGRRLAAGRPGRCQSLRRAGLDQSHNGLSMGEMDAQLRQSFVGFVVARGRRRLSPPRDFCPRIRPRLSRHKYIQDWKGVNCELEFSKKQERSNHRSLFSSRFQDAVF